MQLKLKRVRLRRAVPRWPSRDHRDFQTVGAVSAWRSRRSQPSARSAVLDSRPHGRALPVLSTIAGVRREGAALQIQIARRVAFDDEPARVLDGVRAASSGSEPGHPAVDADTASTWTMTLALN